MIRNNILTAWRNIRRNGFYSALNVTGLAIGLAVGILILLWVRDELSYDGFHRNAASIYKVDSHVGTGASAMVWDGAPPVVGAISNRSVPGVAQAVRIQRHWNEILTSVGPATFPETSSAYVDPGFFTMFDFRLLEGNPRDPFPDDHSIVITRSLAKKYFGDAGPLGKSLLLDQHDRFTVTGVLDDFPGNSSINYDLLLPMDLLAHSYPANGNGNSIDDDPNYTFNIYLRLQPTASPAAVQQKLSSAYQERTGAQPASNFFTLRPLRDVHLISKEGNRNALSIVRIFAAVAILILVIAGINYVNLSTARSMLRSKEVSVRKVIGAGRPQLFFQFMTESAILFFLAAVLAFGLISSLLPVYNNLAAKHLVFSLADPGVWLVVGCTIMGTLAAASIYPALLLSAFRPIDALRGKIGAVGVSNAGFRKFLVITQFTFSAGLILSTVVIRDQLAYIRERDLGFDQSQVFSVRMREGMRQHSRAIMSELGRLPSVEGVAASNNTVAGGFNQTGATWWPGKDSTNAFLITFGFIDESFIPTLRMQLAAGTNFTGTPADSGHYILNETAIREIGLKDPIGKVFSLHGSKGTIIGVVKDFNYKSLKEKVAPLVFSYDSAAGTLYVRTQAGHAADAIAATRHFWRQYDGAYPFNYSFLGEDFDKMYRSDERIGTLFDVFALVAIVISCLGLFGLATYSAQVRIKEIGIRRVLGASVSQVAGLLAKDFLLLIGIAFLIAAPIAGWLMNGWLHNYAYRTSLSAWVFAGTAGSILALAILTICSQAIRAALADPVKSLRSE